MTRLRPRWLSRDLTCLFAARFFRSVAQGYLGIILPLYLAALGHQAGAIGLLFAVSALTGALMAAVVGVSSDRFGRKPFLIIISLLMAFGSIALAGTQNFCLMTAAAALGTIGANGGAGIGGGWGPYYPAAQSLFAENVSAESRTSMFGALSFVGVVGGAAGACFAAVPGLLNRYYGTPITSGYRELILVTSVLGVAMAMVVLPVHERRFTGDTPLSHYRYYKSESPHTGQRVLGLSRRSWRLLVRFMATNATNGLAIGMLGPLLVYWFHRRFGATAADLAQLYFLINLIAALPYLIVGPLTRRLGVVRTVVWTRAIASVLLFVMVFMPSFAWAAFVYVLRMITNVISIPARQSFLMGVMPPEERASAAGLANLPSQATRSLSTWLGGIFMQHVALSLPLEIATAMQALNAVLYYFFFRRVVPPEEERSSDTAAAAGD